MTNRGSSTPSALHSGHREGRLIRSSKSVNPQSRHSGGATSSRSSVASRDFEMCSTWESAVAVRMSNSRARLPAAAGFRRR